MLCLLYHAGATEKALPCSGQPRRPMMPTRWVRSEMIMFNFIPYVFLDDKINCLVHIWKLLIKKDHERAYVEKIDTLVYMARDSIFSVWFCYEFGKLSISSGKYRIAYIFCSNCKANSDSWIGLINPDGISCQDEDCEGKIFWMAPGKLLYTSYFARH